jgi:hypothetical protein
MTFKYINASQVASYTAKGWSCSLMIGHHGVSGYWLAVKS